MIRFAPLFPYLSTHPHTNPCYLIRLLSINNIIVLVQPSTRSNESLKITTRQQKLHLPWCLFRLFTHKYFYFKPVSQIAIYKPPLSEYEGQRHQADIKKTEEKKKKTITSVSHIKFSNPLPMSTPFVWATLTTLFPPIPMMARNLHSHIGHRGFLQSKTVHARTYSDAYTRIFIPKFARIITPTVTIRSIVFIPHLLFASSFLLFGFLFVVLSLLSSFLWPSSTINTVNTKMVHQNALAHSHSTTSWTTTIQDSLLHLFPGLKRMYCNVRNISIYYCHLQPSTLIFPPYIPTSHHHERNQKVIKSIVISYRKDKIITYRTRWIIVKVRTKKCRILF